MLALRARVREYRALMGRGGRPRHVARGSEENELREKADTPATQKRIASGLRMNSVFPAA